MRKRRRAVYLSRVDRERLERGEISAPEEALHRDDPAPGRPAADRPDEKKKVTEKGLSARDREILSERPPHW
ncbi:hypothetical protein [Flaviflexus huanghaiensis]|uniref:hypothetical protein n=1 Tax=Flaviflexus huanghaiensis TaxID=1111473 RepID=UPI0015FC0CD8|nr:hypothetical protein [Flaviflexus huanghaiensis]